MTASSENLGTVTFCINMLVSHESVEVNLYADKLFKIKKYKKGRWGFKTGAFILSTICHIRLIVQQHIQIVLIQCFIFYY